MTHNLNTDINPNHPCANKTCEECDTCMFDQDLFIKKEEKNEKYSSCHMCGRLVKNYIGEDRIQFNACCDAFHITFNGCSRPRIIKSKTGPMLQLTPPEWCPRNRGIIQVSMNSDALINEIKAPNPIPSKETEPIIKTYKTMTYSEKREKLMELPKRIKWDDIEEGGVYVIPKILSQNRKIVKVVIKNDTLLRCCEIDEYGKESQLLSSIYPKDIEAVFITKILNF